MKNLMWKKPISLENFKKDQGSTKANLVTNVLTVEKLVIFASKCPYLNEDPEDEANYSMDIPSISIDIGGKL
jgi:hypothetical protein